MKEDNEYLEILKEAQELAISPSDVDKNIWLLTKEKVKEEIEKFEKSYIKTGGMNWQKLKQNLGVDK